MLPPCRALLRTRRLAVPAKAWSTTPLNVRHDCGRTLQRALARRQRHSVHRSGTCSLGQLHASGLYLTSFCTPTTHEHAVHDGGAPNGGLHARSAWLLVFPLPLRHHRWARTLQGLVLGEKLARQRSGASCRSRPRLAAPSGVRQIARQARPSPPLGCAGNLPISGHTFDHGMDVRQSVVTLPAGFVFTGEPPR